MALNSPVLMPTARSMFVPFTLCLFPSPVHTGELQR